MHDYLTHRQKSLTVKQFSRERSDGQTDGQTDGCTDIWTNATMYISSLASQSIMKPLKRHFYT